MAYLLVTTRLQIQKATLKEILSKEKLKAVVISRSGTKMTTVHITLERRAITHKLLLNHVQMERWGQTEEKEKTTSRRPRKPKAWKASKVSPLLRYL